MATTYPNLVFGRVAQGATMGTLPFREIQTAIVQIEQDLVNAKGGVSTLATYLNRALSATGTLVGSQLHANLLNVTEGQHHPKLHEADHRGGTDSLLAVATRAGLLNSAGFNNIRYAATNATKNDWVLSGAYTGNGGTRLITCGFRPANVLCRVSLAAGNNRSRWNALDGATYVIRHGMVATTPATHVHRRRLAVSSILITDVGFVVAQAVNITSIPYKYIALN